MPSSDLRPVPCVIMRGGTSRGVFLEAKNLPADVATRDRVISAVFGSPHRQQIDGLGGAAVVTSKLAIVGPPSRDDADIDFSFAQVAINECTVDQTGTCGNLSSAVGPYAVDEGYVELVEPVTAVRIHDTNTGKIMLAEVPVRGGGAAVDGDVAIAGLQRPGAAVVMDYAGMVGATTGSLLPTGSVAEAVVAERGTTTLSMLDVAAPVVHVSADAFGVTGSESPDELEALAGWLDALRAQMSAATGIAARYGPGSRLPFVALVGAPKTYTTIDGTAIDAGDVDVLVRLWAVNRIHRSLAAQVAVNVAAAAATTGTVVNELVDWQLPGRFKLRIGHPSGVMTVDVASDGAGKFDRIAYVRTARRIMDGSVYVPVTEFETP